MTQNVVAKGKSEATIELNQPIKLKLKGPIKIPPSVPKIGGLELGPGSEIDVELEAGTIIKLDDKVDIGGKQSSSKVASASAGRSPSSPVPVPGPVPAPTAIPVGTTTLQGAVAPGSTYTWSIPSWFGDAPAVVQVSGTVGTVAYDNALVDNGNGTWTLRPGGLKSFQYSVSGGPAVWQAPFQTPHGLVDGTGSIETVGGMLFEATSDLNSVSGGGGPGFVDDDGNVWQNSYNGSFGVRLSVNGKPAGQGRTTVDGGLNLY